MLHIDEMLFSECLVTKQNNILYVDYVCVFTCDTAGSIFCNEVSRRGVHPKKNSVATASKHFRRTNPPPFPIRRMAKDGAAWPAWDGGGWLWRFGRVVGRCSGRCGCRFLIKRFDEISPIVFYSSSESIGEVSSNSECF